MEDDAAVTGGDSAVNSNSSPIGSGSGGSGVEEAFTAREDEEFCEVSGWLIGKVPPLHQPVRS